MFLRGAPGGSATHPEHRSFPGVGYVSFCSRGRPGKGLSSPAAPPRAHRFIAPLPSRQPEVMGAPPPGLQSDSVPAPGHGSTRTGDDL
jgi:hypothetical protein